MTMLEARYGFATRTILTLFAVTLIYGCSQAPTQQPTQAQGKGAVCQSNVQQLEKVVDGMDTQRGSQKNEVEGSLRNAKAQEDIGKYDECISLASNALNMLGIPPTAKVGAN
jgi:hypothetical protein